MSTKLSDYEYILPEELIAQEPLIERSESRLLVVKDKLEHRRFYDVIDYLNPGDVLVLNDTRVFPGKLIGEKSTGAYAELIIEHKTDNDTYQCRIKTQNPKKGNILNFKYNLTAEVIVEENGKFLVKFNKEPDLDKVGEIPLPHYVKQKLDDYEKYQTVYSKNKGSIAAPTAGLHFTKELLQKIKNKGVEIVKVTLHVNYGTFLPIRTENILDHKMEREYYEITKETADKINNGKRLIVVGTTSFRAIESAADNKGIIKPGKNWTGIYINPKTGIKSKVQMLITNFYLPKTSLLVLVSTFAGREKIMNAYQEAIKRKYRFYSFGDATLLFRANIHPQ